MSLRRTVSVLVLSSALPAASALAQPIATLRWQLLPYCNVITVLVTQQGATYTLDGTDDRCSGGNQAGSAVGIAYLTPLGSVGFGISTVLPNGTPIHTEATISISSLSGTWRDSAGNNGTFVFTPGAPVGGAPRPIPSGGIAPASITNTQLASNAVNSASIVDGSITSVDILDAPRAQFAGSNESLELTSTDVIVRAITITAPTAGRIIMNASGYFAFYGTAAIDFARCSITTGTIVDLTALIAAGEQAPNASQYVPFAGTRGFSVHAGTHTINLVCDEVSGDVLIEDGQLTGIFVAQ